MKLLKRLRLKKLLSIVVFLNILGFVISDDVSLVP